MSYAPFEPLPNENREQVIKRLRKLIADGQDRLEPALAEALMQSAQACAAEEQLETALKRVNEALQIVRRLVREEHQIELNTAVGRCLLFKAAVMRFHSGPQAGVIAFNEAIDHFTEVCDLSNPVSQNELAVALMNKADLLSDPLGAYSAAIAAQDQAVRIWQRLLHSGNTEYRQPMITSLFALGDSKVHSGDEISAADDFKQAAEIIADALEDDNDNEVFQTLHLQAHYKLTRLYDRTGDMPKAFEAVKEAIRTANKLADDETGNTKAVLPSLYLHLGMLYEKIHNPAAALEAYDRCRDAYNDVLRTKSDWDNIQDFMLHNGYANVQMCRGNVLSELRKFKEADTAFHKAVSVYQDAAEHRPADHDDETLTPYSIGVVMLNRANMLATMGRFEEAAEIQKQAIAALQLRMTAGHDEIIPNLISAYRKMIAIQSMLGGAKDIFHGFNNVDTFHWLNHIINLLEKAVDDGKFEYRSDLASSYRHRAVLHEEQGGFPEAEKDVVRSMNLFRLLADDDTDKAEVHFAKIQWSETLQQVAVLMIRQQKVQEAVAMLRKAVADIESFYADGNESVCVDVLLAYSQFIEMIEGILRSSSFSDRPLKETAELPDDIRIRLERLQTLDSDKEPLPQGVTEHSPDDFQKWIQDALLGCAAGSKLSLQKKDDHKGDLTARLFFEMKYAYFIKMHGALLHLAAQDKKACGFFETAAERYLELIESIKNLKAKDKYYAAEKGEPMPDWDILGSGSDDPYMDRFAYYANEYRQTVQFWAYSQLALGNREEAEKLYDKENTFSWELVKKGVPNADRWLINSLWARANCTADLSDFETVNSLYSQVLELLRMRFSGGDTNWEDFFMTKNIHKTYALFLHRRNKTDMARRVMGEFAGFLETVKAYPPADLWLSLCQTLDVNENWCSDAKQIKGIRKTQKRLSAKHPEYVNEPALRDYAETLDKEIEG
ncbi:MAG: tetratricopeptide repeat protein [Planctomycetaceae bacterium]|jgi:tetratricopeptide (TPR) repeat protein|nr:tetratricopeptide repeat protein [Planctomycetaceae bacterium]